MLGCGSGRGFPKTDGHPHRSEVAVFSFRGAELLGIGFFLPRAPRSNAPDHIEPDQGSGDDLHDGNRSHLRNSAMAIIVLPGGHRLLGETDRNEASIRVRAGLPAGATLDQPNSSFANALLRLVHLGGDLADGNSVYPNVPKGLSRASQPVTSLIRGDPPPPLEYNGPGPYARIRTHRVAGSYPGRQPSTWTMEGSSYLGLLLRWPRGAGRGQRAC